MRLLDFLPFSSFLLSFEKIQNLCVLVSYFKREAITQSYLIKYTLACKGYKSLTTEGKEVCARVFFTALFVIAKKGNKLNTHQCKCSSNQTLAHAFYRTLKCSWVTTRPAWGMDWKPTWKWKQQDAEQCTVGSPPRLLKKTHIHVCWFIWNISGTSKQKLLLVVAFLDLHSGSLTGSEPSFHSICSAINIFY